MFYKYSTILSSNYASTSVEELMVISVDEDGAYKFPAKSLETVFEEYTISNGEFGSRGIVGNYFLGKNFYFRNSALNSSYAENIDSDEFGGIWRDVKFREASVSLDKFSDQYGQFELINGIKLKSKPKIFFVDREDGEKFVARDQCADVAAVCARTEIKVESSYIIDREERFDISTRDDGNLLVLDEITLDEEIDCLVDRNDNEQIFARPGIKILLDYGDRDDFFEIDCGKILRINKPDRFIPKQNILSGLSHKLQASQSLAIDSKAIRIVDNLELENEVIAKVELLYGDENFQAAIKNESYKYIDLLLNGLELWGKRDYFRVAPGEFFKVFYNAQLNKLFVLKKIAYLNITSSSGLFFKPGELEELTSGGGGGGDLSIESDPTLRLKPPGQSVLLWGDNFGISQEDIYETWTNTPIVLESFEEGVLINDAGAAGNLNIKVEGWTQPSYGTLEFTNVNLGTFTYIPNLDFEGEDKFTYYTIDNAGYYSTLADVLITVSSYEDYLANKFGAGKKKDDGGGGGGGGGGSGGGGPDGGALSLKMPGGISYIKQLGLDGEYGLAGKKIYKKNLLTNQISLFSDLTFDKDSVTLTEDYIKLNCKDVDLFANDQFNKKVWYLAYLIVNGVKVLPGVEYFVQNFGTIRVTADGLISLNNVDAARYLKSPDISYTVSNGYFYPSQKIFIDNRSGGGGLGGDGAVEEDEEPAILKFGVSGMPGDTFSINVYDEIELVDVELVSLGFGLKFNQQYEASTGNTLTFYSNGLVEGTIGAESDFFYIFTNNPEQILAIEFNISIPINANNTYINILNDRVSKIPISPSIKLYVAGALLGRNSAILKFREQSLEGSIASSKNVLTINPSKMIGPSDDSIPDRQYSYLTYYDVAEKKSGLYIIWASKVRDFLDFRAARPRFKSMSRLPDWSIFIMPLKYPDRTPFSNLLYVERVRVGNVWHDFTELLEQSDINSYADIPLLDTIDDSILGNLHVFRTGRVEYIGIKNGNAPKSLIVRVGFGDSQFKDYSLKLVLAKVEDKPNTYEITESGEDDIDTREEDKTEEENLEKFEHVIKLLEGQLKYCEVSTDEIYKIDFETEITLATATTICDINSLYLRPINYTPANYEYSLNYCDNGGELTTIIKIEYVLQTYKLSFCDEEVTQLYEIDASQKLLEQNLSYCDYLEEAEGNISYSLTTTEQQLNYCEIAPLNNTLLEDSNSNILSYSSDGSSDYD